MDQVVVVGAGIAGVQTAVSLREAGYDGRLTIIGAEPHAPYDRPPLSKEVLLGKAEHSRLDVDFVALGVDLVLGRRIRALDDVAEADAVVLATGAEPLTLPGQPASARLLRTHDDALALRAVLRPGARVVIVGAGWIGAEAASAAREAGCEVVVLEAASSPPAGEFTRCWFAEAGVDLRTGAAVSGFLPAGDGVVLTDGSGVRADVLLVGIGARPATAWLSGSDVPLDDRGAVAADDRLRAAPGVWAVGDCASFPSARYGRRLTVHHWDHALASAKVVAANVLGGDEVYDPVPYFWSEQFGRMVQSLGVAAPTDRRVARGNAGDAVWLRADGTPTAALFVDRPRDLAQAKRLLAQGTPLDPERVADPAVPLKQAVAAG
ncbi:NAD(P)/FAD-dependent oxidoreductase [Streptacidiphilus monticola]|uniref:NAD(P)/FAD-dependent oxidoreductase n=1 Tax=Streptacidiphilus monticola TaxID=2161674 RepID=A0ABW1FYZ0_9ACTN